MSGRQFLAFFPEARDLVTAQALATLTAACRLVTSEEHLMTQNAITAMALASSSGHLRAPIGIIADANVATWE
jgi:hypothetical protein